MKIIFSDRENQHLEATPATVRVGSARRSGQHRRAMFAQVACETLTYPRVRGNLLVKYENMILTREEALMRLPPLPADEWNDAARQSVASLLPEDRRNPSDAGNLLSTLARHPDLCRAFLKFNGYLLMSSTLPAR